MHMDIVRNDWSVGLQRRVASVEQIASSFKVTRTAPGWDDLSRRPLISHKSAFVTLEDCRGDDVEQGWTALRTTFSGSHIFAFGPHDDSECPFYESDEVGMRSDAP